MFATKPSVTLVRMALASLAGVTLLPAIAQEKSTAEPKVQRVEITGSNIKRVDKEGVSPVTTITKEQIARSGATSVMDLMRDLAAIGNNGGEYAGSNSFRNGATEASLRGLPTLVLLNGYRLPMSGSDGYSGGTSVDLNTLPLAAIERVEVLKDGASAIYGTDAVGGVINFITKQSSTGVTVDASIGRTTWNDGGVGKASVSGGFGDRGQDNFNLTYALSAEKTQAIRGKDRDWANKTDFTSMGGLYQGSVYGAKGTDPGTLSLGGSQRMPDPACDAAHKKPYPDAPEWFAAQNRNACMYSTAEGIDLRSPMNRYSLTSVLNYDVSENTSVFAQLFMNHYDTKMTAPPSWIQNADRSGAMRVAANNPFNTYGVPVVIRRLFPASEGGTKSDVNSVWMVAGAKTTLKDWELSFSAGHSEERGDIRVLGSYMHDKMQDYLNTGKFNPFGGNNNSAQIINELTADQFVKTKAKTDFVKLLASTELSKLPGGAIGLALGTEAKRESISYTPSSAWQNGEIANYTILRGIQGSENLKALFGEVSLPLLKSLEVQAAVRYDNYQYAGSTTNPKLGIRWKAMDQLMVRTSYSTGFRAPSLSQRFSEGRGGFGMTRDPKRCLTGNVYFEQSCSGSVLSLVSGTKDLQPEKSSQFNLGFIFEPTQNLSLGLTYWNIRWTNRIDSLDNDIVLAGEDGAYKNNVTRLPVSQDDLDAYNALTPAQRAAMGPLVGRLKQLTVGFINRSKVTTSGFDLDASYTIKTPEAGKFRIYGDSTYTVKYDTSLLEGDPLINCHGTMGCESGQYRNPSFIGNLGVAWEKGAWATNTSLKYTSAYHVPRNPDDTINRYYDMYERGFMVGASTVVNASVTYTGFKNTTLRVGVNNLFNRDPSFDVSSSIGYDREFGDPRGRYVYVSGSYRF